MSKWHETGASAANTAKTLTHAAVSGRTHHITGVEVSIKGADASADITIDLKDGSTIIWSEVIGSGQARGIRVGFMLPDNDSSLPCSQGSATSLVVGAGGAGVVTVCNFKGFTL